MTEEARDSHAPVDAESSPAPHPPLDIVAEAGVLVAVSRELVHDSRTLMKIGAGLYEMELLAGRCRQGFRYHPTPAIAGFVRARMLHTVQGMGLEWSIVTAAHLNLKIALEEKDPAKGYKPMMVFGRYEGIYVLCRIETTVTVTTAEGSWSASGRGAIDWPRDWGKLGL